METPESEELSRPGGLLSTKLLGIPVRGARAWATALVPNKRGGWNFITQTYAPSSESPPEFVVLDLEAGNFSVTPGLPAVYTNSNYQFDEQLRAPNGRVFLPELDNQIAYYDPIDEKVKQVGKLVDSAEDKLLYRVVFGPNGKLYGGTQSTGLPTIFELDPDTLAFRVIGKVGKDRLTYSYAYYLAVDRPWIYVAVGEHPWELAALNITTGESRILATRANDGFMQLDTRAEGVTATLIAGVHTPQQHVERVWCIDGQLLPFQSTQQANLPFQARNVQPVGAPVQNAPQLDTSAASPDAEAVGRVYWRPHGSNGGWKESKYTVKFTAAVDIDSLVALSDGTLLGSAKQYHGFFRYNPKERASKHYGSFALSGGPRATVNGLVYISGYPNGALYVFDPARPWSTSTNVRAGAPVNPRHLGNFVQAGAHYPYFLVPSVGGRLYYSGRRERDGIGGGVGYYDPSTKVFGGHHLNLSLLDPQGLVVMDEIHRVVYSGRAHADPSQPNSPRAEAQLIVYDYDLKEIERQTVKAGMTNTGLLFNTNTNNVIIGLSNTDNVVYRYDVARRKLLEWVELAGVVGAATQRTSDASIWILVDNALIRIDSTNMKLLQIGKLAIEPSQPDLLTWQNDHLYWGRGSELREIFMPRTH